jgi:hypothetical protein
VRFSNNNPILTRQKMARIKKVKKAGKRIAKSALRV